MKKFRFFTPGTLEEMKTQYRVLSRSNHPDLGGDLRTMQDINGEWADILSTHAFTEATERTAAANAEGKKGAGDYHDLNQVRDILRREIIFILNMGLGIKVELMGLWVWATGDTYPHRDEFKEHNKDAEIKWIYSGPKKAWYFAGVPSMSRKHTPLKTIRAMYGSIQFTEKDLNVAVNA